MSDELDGWSDGELVTISRWHLMRGDGLSGQNETWEIGYSPDGGVVCGDRDQVGEHHMVQTRQPVDGQEVAEGRRLLAHVYPRTRVTLRRCDLTEHERSWR